MAFSESISTVNLSFSTILIIFDRLQVLERVGRLDNAAAAAAIAVYSVSG